MPPPVAERLREVVFLKAAVFLLRKTAAFRKTPSPQERADALGDANGGEQKGPPKTSPGDPFPVDGGFPSPHDTFEACGDRDRPAAALRRG
jgi:hypothetical protein